MHSSFESKTRIRKRLVSLLTFVTGLLGLHGLNSYYETIIPSFWRRVSVTLYGLLQLFLFSSPIPDKAITTWTYEVAKWVAPILTSALVLTTLLLFVRHYWNMLRNRFGNHIIIVGYNDFIHSFIQNLRVDKSNFRISLLGIKPLPLDIEKDFEKKGVAIHSERLFQATEGDLKYLSQKIMLNRTKFLVLSNEDEMIVLTHVIKLLTFVKPRTSMSWYIQLTSKVFREYVLETLDTLAKQDACVRQIKIIFFDLADLEVESLLQSSGIIQYQFKNIKKLDIDLLTPEIIDANLGIPHLLIFGKNKFTNALINRSVNDLTISLEKKIIVTHLVSRFEEGLEKFYSSNIDRCINYRLHYYDNEKGSIETYLEMLEKEKNPPTCIFLADENTNINLEMLAKIGDHFLNTPVFFRNREGYQFAPIFDHNLHEVIQYGNHSHFMTPSVILNEELNESAIAFNQDYNKIAKMTSLEAGNEWSNLSQVKKDSSRASASHARTKMAILKAIYGSNEEDIDVINKKLRSGIEWLRNAQKNYSKEEFRNEFIAYLKSEPVIDYLTRLEHKRWCNSYYLLGFTHGELKDEKKLTHPCLIEDWLVIISDRFYKCHPQYDLISVFALAKD